MRIVLPLVLLFSLWFSACGRKGTAGTPFAAIKPITEEKVYQIKRDSSDRAAITGIFGDPAKKTISDRGETYIYSYFDDSLYVNFNNNRIVSGFQFIPATFQTTSSNVDNDERKVTRKNLSKISEYHTTRIELDNLLGQPNIVEESPLRQRLTWFARDGLRVIVTTRKSDGRVITYETRQKEA